MPTLLEFINFLGLMLSPVIAIQVQKWLQDRQNKIERKRTIFRTLLTSRGNQNSEKCLEALHLIDIEFKDSKSAEVIEKWQTYSDYLINNALPDSKTQDEHYTALLFAISKHLKYNHDISILRKNYYTPKSLFTRGEYEKELLELIREIREGKIRIPIVSESYLLNNETEITEKLNQFLALRIEEINRDNNHINIV